MREQTSEEQDCWKTAKEEESILPYCSPPQKFTLVIPVTTFYIVEPIKTTS